MITELKIKLANNDDLQTLSLLDSKTNLTFWNLNQYVECFNNRICKIFVCVLDKRIIGAIVVSIAEPEIEILQLWIVDSYQNQGVATKLFNYVLEKLESNFRITKVFLEVRCNNQPAIKLYNKLGFKEIGIRRNYYKIDAEKIDAIVMLLEVNNEK